MNRTKKALAILAALCLVVGIAGFVSWNVVAGGGSGNYGQHWAAWNTAIDVIWVVIPIAFALSFAAAVISLFLKPRSGAIQVVAVVVVAVVTLASAWLFFVMTHLKIS